MMPDYAVRSWKFVVKTGIRLHDQGINIRRESKVNVVAYKRDDGGDPRYIIHIRRLWPDEEQWFITDRMEWDSLDKLGKVLMGIMKVGQSWKLAPRRGAIKPGVITIEPRHIKPDIALKLFLERHAISRDGGDDYKHMIAGREVYF